MRQVFGSFRLSLRLRTFAGFAALLLLCGVLAVTSVVGMRVVGSSVEDSRQSSGVAISAMKLAGEVAQLNSEVSRFALTGTAGDEAAARQQLTATAQAFNTATQAIGATSEDDIRTAFDHYRVTTEATFETVHDRFKAGDGVKQASTELSNATSAVVSRLSREKQVEAVPNGIRLDEAT